MMTDEYDKELEAVHVAQDAYRLLEKGDVEGAKNLFEKSVSCDGEFDETLGVLGALELLKGSEKRAEDLLKRAVELNGGNVDALVILPILEKPIEDRVELLRSVGEGYLNFMQYPRAYLFYRETWRLNPSDTSALAAMAFLSREMGHLQRSEEEYRELLQILPESWEVMFDLSTVLIKRGEFEEAEEMLKRASVLASDVPQIWNNLGFLREIQGDLKGARRFYERAIEIDEMYYPSYYSIGRILQKEGRNNEAMEYLERGLEIRSIFQIEDIEGAERRRADESVHAKEVVTTPTKGVQRRKNK